MTTSELGFIYKMRKEKREEERKEREQQQQQLEKDEAQIQSRVNTLRQSNMQNAQNLKTIGGAVAHGVLAGTSEALTEKALKRQQFKEYLDEMTNAIAEEKRNFQQTQITMDWLRQNYNGLGAIVSFLPQMGAVRARRAIQPYINDLGQALGENADITDINTETGMITIKTDKNELEQMNLYDMFPGIKSLFLRQRGLQAGGFYGGDADLEEQLWEQNQANQQRLDRSEAREDERLNLAKQRWAYERDALDAQRMQQEQQFGQEEDVIDETGQVIVPTQHELKLFDRHNKIAEKRVPEINKEILSTNNNLSKTDNAIQALDTLVNIRNEIDKDPQLAKSWLILGRGKATDQLRRLINDIPALLKPFTNEKERSIVQQYLNASRKYIVALYPETARAIMNNAAIRNQKEFEAVQETLPSLFGSKEGFKQNINASLQFFKGVANQDNHSLNLLNNELDSYYMSAPEFAKLLRQKRRK